MENADKQAIEPEADAQPIVDEVTEDIVEGKPDAVESPEIEEAEQGSVPLIKHTKLRTRAQEAEDRAEKLEREAEALKNELNLRKAAFKPTEPVEDDLILPNPDDFYGDPEGWIAANREYNQKNTERLKQINLDATRQMLEKEREDARQAELQAAEAAKFEQQRDAYLKRADSLKADDFTEREDQVRAWVGEDLYRRLITDVPNAEQVVFALSNDKDKVIELLQTFEANPWAGVTKVNEFAGSLDPIKKQALNDEFALNEPIKGGAGGLVDNVAKFKSYREKARLSNGTISMNDVLAMKEKLGLKGQAVP